LITISLPVDTFFTDARYSYRQQVNIISISSSEYESDSMCSQSFKVQINFENSPRNDILCKWKKFHCGTKFHFG